MSPSVIYPSIEIPNGATALIHNGLRVINHLDYVDVWTTALHCGFSRNGWNGYVCKTCKVLLLFLYYNYLSISLFVTFGDVKL